MNGIYILHIDKYPYFAAKINTLSACYGKIHVETNSCTILPS
jgi:hypothetical protein